MFVEKGNFSVGNQFFCEKKNKICVKNQKVRRKSKCLLKMAILGKIVIFVKQILIF